MEQHGFQVVEDGSWEEMVTFCSRLADVLADHVDDDVYQRFDSWRPKQEESKHDVRGKTAKEEAIAETAIEENSDGVKEEMVHAGHEMRKSGQNMVQRKPKESLNDAEDAGASAARSLFPPLIRIFRAIEEALYVNVMGKTSPNYFECDAFTVALEREFLDRDTYKVRVVMDDEELLDDIVDRMDREQE